MGYLDMDNSFINVDKSNPIPMDLIKGLLEESNLLIGYKGVKKGYRCTLDKSQIPLRHQKLLKKYDDKITAWEVNDQQWIDIDLDKIISIGG